MSQPSKKSRGESSSSGAPSLVSSRVPPPAPVAAEFTTFEQCVACRISRELGGGVGIVISSMEGRCREPRRCYQCGQADHIRTQCPLLTRGDPASGLNPGHPTQSRGSQPAAQAQTTATRSVAASNTPQSGGARPQTRSQTRIFALTNEEPKCEADMITGEEVLARGKDLAEE
ncbi:uncharacterized protein LOC120277694 [Dioscorea cayenensis subsp. rotundata]|uniref:Uncharacterized protein LOC120277694 n=1 Tax=Dioscorea cayennensis subsp. rotundata TaxID=55577 RepID=A0AB40CK87_DIOCR|nr:uncharacterized protein LOC120277694 [Dioscorea cayenensis subsp. rotundata]